jgi:two-component system NarL family sensor kinase
VTLGLTDGPNAHFRIAALVRVAIIPLFLISETFFEQSVSPSDLATVGPVMVAGVAYALITLVCAFGVRRPLPLAPFAIADIVIVGLICYGEGGTAADVHFAFVVPPLVAAFIGRPRDCAALAALALAAYVTSSVLYPTFGEGDSVRDVLVHGLDMVWRGGLAVGLSVILTRRGDRIRNLAESRRALVTQALGAEAHARRELAYSLHDGLVQGLLSARQDLKAARRGQPGYLDRAEVAIEQAIDQLRGEIFELHPHQLENGGLASALVAVAESLARPGGPPAVVAVVPEAERIDDGLAFAIGRELMANACRHADASAIALTVTLERDHLVVCCEDDGRGMDAARRAEAVAGGHIGLAACTERVEAVGGRLLVDSALGRGTRVRAEIPAAPALRRADPAPSVGGEPVPVPG